MTVYLIDKILKKKQQYRYILKISFTSVLIFLCLFIISYIANVFILSYSAQKVLKEMENNQNGKVSFTIKKDFLKSKIFLNELNISIDSGNVYLKSLELKKKAGFLIPSIINMDFDEIISTDKYGTSYKIIKKDNKQGMDIKLNKHFFKLPDFGGVKFNSKTTFTIKEKSENVSNIDIDKFEFIIKNNYSSLDYKGLFSVHSGNLITSSSFFDLPVKFNIKLLSNSFVNKNEKITQLKFDKCFIDMSESKISFDGMVTYDKIINNLDMNVVIDNDAKLIDKSFNYILKQNNDPQLKYKRMHSYMKKTLIPKLKKLNDKSNNKILFLKLEKTNIMPEIVVNGIGLSEIAQEMSNFMR